MSPKSWMIAVGALALVSCEEPYDFEGELPARLLLETRIAAGQPPAVSLRAVDGFGSTLPGDDLASAFVTIRDGGDDDRLIELASLGTDGGDVAHFVAPERDIAVAGLRYSLRVDAVGYAPLSSTTTVPGAARVTLGAGSTQQLTTDTTAGTVGLPFTLRDASPADEYYHVLVRGYESGASEASIVAQPSIAFALADVDNATVSSSYGGLLFPDEAFVGGQLATSLLVPRAALAAYATPVLRVEVRTVSAGYFNHYTSDSPKPGTGGAPAVSTERVVGGLGFFGSYNAVVTDVELDF